MAELFNVVATLTLDSKQYDAQVNAVQQRVIPINSPELKLDTKEYDKGIDEAGDKAEEFGEKAGGAFNKVEQALTAAGIVTAVTKIAEAFKGAIDYTSQLGDDISKGARSLQISTHSYQAFDHALQMNSGSVGDLRTGVKNLNKILSDGSEVTGEAGDAFRSLGVDFYDANGKLRDTNELISDTVLALSQMEAGEERDTLVQTLFGADYERVNKLLAQGKDGVDELLSSADDLDLTILGNFAKGKPAEAFNELGIDLRKANGELKTMDEVLTETLFALSRISDEDERGRLTEALFGSSGSDSIKNLLATGEEGVRKLLNEADELNLILSDEEIKNAEDYQDAVFNLQESLKHLQSDFTKTILPILTEAVNAITNIINFFRGKGMGGGLFAGGSIVSGLAAGGIVKWGGKKLLNMIGLGGGEAASGGIGTTLKGLLTGEGGMVQTLLSGLKTTLVEAAPIFATQFGLVLVSTLPAVLTQDLINEDLRKKQQAREAAARAMAQTGNVNAQFVEVAAAALGLEKDENGEEAKNILGQSFSRYNGQIDVSLMGLRDRRGQEMAMLQMALLGKEAAGNDAWQMLNRYWAGEGFDQIELDELLGVVTDALIEQFNEGVQSAATGVRARRQLPAGYWYDSDGNILNGEKTEKGGDVYWDPTNWDDRAWNKWIEEHGGTPVEVQPDITDAGIANMQAELDAASLTVGVSPYLADGEEAPGHAKGLWDVPYDNYPALLHRDEMVLTKSQARRYRDGEMNADYGMLGALLGSAVEGAMRRVNVLMSGEKVGDITTKRVKRNINAQSFARVRSMGG